MATDSTQQGCAVLCCLSLRYIGYTHGADQGAARLQAIELPSVSNTVMPMSLLEVRLCVVSPSTFDSDVVAAAILRTTVVLRVLASGWRSYRRHMQRPTEIKAKVKNVVAIRVVSIKERWRVHHPLEHTPTHLRPQPCYATWVDSSST